MNYRKPTAAPYITFLAALIVALPLWAQGPIADVLVDAEEVFDVPCEHCLSVRLATGLAAPEVATVNSGSTENVVQQAQTGDPWTEIVGRVSCRGVRVHNPHKSGYSGTVKVAAEGSCRFLPNPSLGANRYPGPHQLTFTMYIYLSGGIASANADFPKNGYRVRWDQNSTVADTGRCRNGFYYAHMYVIVTVSGPFFVVGDPRIAGNESQAYVSTC